MFDMDELEELERERAHAAQAVAEVAPSSASEPAVAGTALAATGAAGAGDAFDFYGLDAIDAPAVQAAPTTGAPPADQATSSGAEKPWSLPEEILKTLPVRAQVQRPRKLADVVNKVVKGEFWGLEFPFYPDMLKEWGPAWLTKAMHTAGTLPRDNEVTQFVTFDVKAADVTKEDAENAKWGGAGVKILMTVAYKNDSGHLPEGMFVKLPHPLLPGNERAKNSGASSGDWPETVWYNIFGGRFGSLPFPTPRSIFSDMSRETTNFIHIIELLPLGQGGFDAVEPGYCYPAPEKYRDWALPGHGVDFYYAHARTLAQFFGWHTVTRRSTNRVECIFYDDSGQSFLDRKYADMKAAGSYNSQGRDQHFVKSIQGDPEVQFVMSTLAAQPSAYLSFLQMGQEFVELVKHVFPTELVTKGNIDRFFDEAREIQMYHLEMRYHARAIPEFYSIEHPNAQVDNAWYWKDEAGAMQCGLLDWGGVFPGSIPNCIGNGWMGAETCMMDEHEEKLLRFFIDEFEKVTGLRFDFEDLWMHVKLAQGLVLPGCCCNTQRIRGTVDWKKVRSRKDPQINDNFLGRCYFVQMELFLGMWRKRSPYAAFQRWRKRLNLPVRKPPKV